MLVFIPRNTGPRMRVNRLLLPPMTANILYLLFSTD